MGRTCQLIFSPSITTMLVQCIGSTAGGGVRRKEEDKDERAYAGPFDSKRMGRAVTRTISGVQERPYWGRASNSKCTLERPPNLNLRLPTRPSP